MSDHSATSLPSPGSPEVAEPGDSRRAFLRRTALVTAPALALAAEARAAGPKAEASNQGRSSGALRRYFQEIQGDENAHVQELTKDLGPFAGPAPTFQNLQARTLNEFIALSQVFENTGVGAYQGAAGLIQNKGILGIAAAIAFVEAYHAGWVNSIVGSPLVPDGLPFSVPLTQDQVVQRAQPFIASLNGPLPTISTTPSFANDFAILNFALILERLEAEFYNINVPRLFG